MKGAGTKLVVANYENDSVSVVELATGMVSDVDLRPGKAEPSRVGTPGGDYPFWVAIQGDSAFVSSQRDAEVVVVDLAATPRVTARIPVASSPGRCCSTAPGGAATSRRASDGESPPAVLHATQGRRPLG